MMSLLLIITVMGCMCMATTTVIAIVVLIFTSHQEKSSYARESWIEGKNKYNG